MKRKTLANFIGITLCIASSQAAIAKDQPDVSLAELQTALLNHIDLVGSPSLQQRFAELDTEQWQFIFDSFQDKSAFVDATIKMESLALSRDASGAPLVKSRNSTEKFFEMSSIQAVSPAVTFSPPYPSGADYTAFTATMPGLGLLYDSPDIGTEMGTALNDERCDANAEAGAQIALGALKVAAEIGNTACSATPSPFEPAVCIPAGVLNEAVIADEIVLAQCGYQTALVDSAEIEATFENSVELIGTVNNVDNYINDETNFTDDSELAVHDSDIKNVINVHDTDIKNVVDVHDTDIKNVVTVHDADIKNVVSIHDTDIKNALSTHDTDIKALLANIQAGVDSNGEKLDLLLDRQLEVVRLLHTPNGQRSTDIPACNGAPCSWNPK